LIICLIIQTIGLDPSGAVWTDEAANLSRPDPSEAVWTDEASNVSRLDPSEAVQIDAEHPSRNRKVEGSNPPQGASSWTPCEAVVWMWAD
jgi:hypothetical protein